MGARKKKAAEARKEENRTRCVARLVDNNTSPRKARLMADLVRGKNVDYALNVLKYSKKESAEKIRKVLLSAVANWQAKNENSRVEDSHLYVKEIFVDGSSFNGIFEKPSDIYSISGILIQKNATSLIGLKKGTYVINGKKIQIK